MQRHISLLLVLCVLCQHCSCGVSHSNTDWGSQAYHSGSDGTIHTVGGKPSLQPSIGHGDIQKAHFHSNSQGLVRTPSYSQVMDSHSDEILHSANMKINALFRKLQTSDLPTLTANIKDDPEVVTNVDTGSSIGSSPYFLDQDSSNKQVTLDSSLAKSEEVSLHRAQKKDLSGEIDIARSFEDRICRMVCTKCKSLLGLRWSSICWVECANAGRSFNACLHAIALDIKNAQV